MVRRVALQQRNTLPGGVASIVQNSKPVSQQSANFKILSENRSAGHNYHLLDRYEAGMVLTGTEVKSAKTGKIQLKEAYAEISDGEAWLINAHISEYLTGDRIEIPLR